MDYSSEIISDINTVLETTWSETQLVKGKWFEINPFWSKQLISDIVLQYRLAGWRVSQHVEIIPGSVKKYLSFTHPKFYKD